MAEKVENMSLDDIIKQRNKGRGGIGRKFAGRGRGRAASRGPLRASGGGVAPLRQRRNFGNVNKTFLRDSGNIDGRWQHDLFENGVSLGRGRLTAGGSTKLLVSNLDFGVSDTDISELFSEFGPLKIASIHYDRSGRSLGLADVVFERRADANNAIKVYNNVPLDGRPMKIKFADELNAAPAPMVSRPQRRQPNFAGRSRGVGRGRGRPNAGGAAKKNVTVEELDAELDAWKMTE